MKLNSGNSETATASQNGSEARRVVGNGKRPWFGLWAADHLTDPCLRKCSPATRGIWMDMVCLMWLEDESGEISGTVEQLKRLAGCESEEMASAIIELAETDAADVLKADGEAMAKNGKTVLPYRKTEWQIDSKTDVIIIRNRRMYKAHIISNKRAKAGLAGAEKRWQNDGKPKWQNDSKPSISASTSVSSSTRPGNQARPGKQESGTRDGQGVDTGPGPGFWERQGVEETEEQEIDFI
jgi:hypothetical protein